MTVGLIVIVFFQWFGNRVGYEWWDYAWVSEGFSSYLKNRGTEDVFGWSWVQAYIPAST